MSTAASTTGGGTREQGRSELGVALFLGALGLLVIVSALMLPESRIARGPVGPGRGALVVGSLLLDHRRVPRRRRVAWRPGRARGRRGHRARRRHRLEDRGHAGRRLPRQRRC